MDQKSWLWKKRSTEKTLVADKGNTPLTKNEEVTEIQKLQTEKTELEKDVKTLEGKLSSAVSESSAKENIAKKQVKIAEEAIAGWEKAEVQARSLKQELDKVLQQKAASEKRICHLDGALKECMHQLRFVWEEQEKRVHGAVLKTSEAFEKVRIALDEKLTEAGRRLAKLGAENTQLIKALSGKDKVIEDLSNYRTRLEADFNALTLRVEATEKENTSLKYEICVLEKKLDIRNEEREFSRQTAEAAQKQHLKNTNKIGKLEMECQKLRLLVRKRLPSAAALAKIKSEIEVLRKHQVETRRIKSNPNSSSSLDSCVHDPANKRIDILTQKLYKLEGENKTLKVNKTSQTEGQVQELVKDEKIEEPGRHLQFLEDHSLIASSDMGSDDKASCAESWASALISELEHFKNEKQWGMPSYRRIVHSDMNLMDDFAKMEKAAGVSVDYPSGSSHHSFQKSNEIVSTALRPSCQHSSSEPLISDQEIRPEQIAAYRAPHCLSDMLKVLSDHCCASRRNPHEVLEDMKSALAQDIEENVVFCGHGSAHHPDVLCCGSGIVIPTSPRKSMNLDGSEPKKSDQKFPSTVSISIHKIVELLEGLNMHSQDNGVADSFSGYRNSENTAGYIVRAFQWKTTELSSILQQLISNCNDLLNGTANLEQFGQQVASNLEWVINHCFSIQDVSSMKDAIRNHFDWDESMSDGEVECGSAVPSLSSRNRTYSHMEAPKDDFRNVDQANTESSLADLEVRLQSEIDNGECFRIQLEESRDAMESLHSQIETLMQIKGETGNQTEKRKMMKEDLEAQLMESNNQWKEAYQKILCLEDELENKNITCKRLEETCQELQTKLESVTSNKAPGSGDHWEKQLETDWEITTASEKLAQCQETILNLGKQLKALASPSDAALFNKVISKPDESVATSPSATQRNTTQRSSLLDKVLAEDNDKISASPCMKADIQNTDNSTSAISGAAFESRDKFTTANEINRGGKTENAAASMNIITHKKKRGWSIFRKLFWRRKKGNTDKTPCSN